MHQRQLLTGEVIMVMVLENARVYSTSLAFITKASSHSHTSYTQSQTELGSVHRQLLQ